MTGEVPDVVTDERVVIEVGGDQPAMARAVTTLPSGAPRRESSLRSKIASLMLAM